MKDKVKDIIKILGVGMNELILDIDLGDVTFNSIEWDENEGKVLLHIFEDDDYDYFVDFDDLSSEQQNKIYVLLSIITYN
jgi:hypothetical protein